MKKIISVLILIVVLVSFTRCKVYEFETIEKIPNPGVSVDTVIIPGWE